MIGMLLRNFVLATVSKLPLPCTETPHCEEVANTTPIHIRRILSDANIIVFFISVSSARNVTKVGCAKQFILPQDNGEWYPPLEPTYSVPSNVART